jgi:hypothetical protein
MTQLASSPANLSCQAKRVSRAEKIEQIQAQPAVLRATIHITRKATGKVETYEIVGTPMPQEQ